MKCFQLLWIYLIPVLSFAQVDHYETVVYADNLWRYMPGTEEPPTTWTALGFNDNDWEIGVGGIGYGDGDDGTNIAPVVSLYMRHEFEIVDKTKIENLILYADFDDAFVAYLNGVELTRYNLDGFPPTFDTESLALHEASLYQGELPESFAFTADIVDNVLLEGNNVLSFQVHNYDGLSSSDMSSNFFLNVGINDDSFTYGNIPNWIVLPPEPIGPFTTHMPILKINTFGEEIPDEPSISGTMGIIWNGEGNPNSSDEDPNEFFGNISIERRGQSSLYFFPKTGFAIETKDDAGEDMDVSFLNFPEEEDWILHGPYSDKSLMRNVLAMHLANEMGPFNSRTRYVELLINDAYEGIYVLMEKIKADASRVDIADLNLDDNEGDELTGGYIFKIDKDDNDWWSQYDVESFYDEGPLAFQYVSPKRSKITSTQESYIQSYVDSFEMALKSPDYSFAGKRYTEYADILSFIDHLILKELAKDVDAYRISSYYYKKKDSNGGKIFAGPAWDFNIAFGNADYCDAAHWGDWMYDLNCGFRPFWWQRFLSDPIFVEALQCRWAALKEGAFSIASVHAYIDEQAAYLLPSIGRNFQRWPVLNEYIWPNAEIPGSFEGEIDYLKLFVNDRLTWMDDHIDNIECTSSIHEQVSSALLVKHSPNPFNENLLLEINFPERTDLEIEIYDALGELVYYKNLEQESAGKTLIDIEPNIDLDGIYFCKINTDFASKLIKIIKTN